jgi:hypothetical protein
MMAKSKRQCFTVTFSSAYNSRRKVTIPLTQENEDADKVGTIWVGDVPYTVIVNRRGARLKYNKDLRAIRPPCILFTPFAEKE